LLAMGKQCVTKDHGTWLASVRRSRDDWPQLLESIGALYAKGASIDWSAFDRDYPRRKISLPSYPFQRERFWLDGVESQARPRGRAASASGADRSNDGLYRLEWRIPPHAEQAGPADYLPAPAEIAERASTLLQQPYLAQGLDQYKGLLPQMETLAKE